MKLKSFLCFIVLLTYYQGEAQIRVEGLEEKVQQLTDLTAKKSIINLNKQKFIEYVKSPPRNYAFIVLFTSMSPHLNCEICQQIYDEYVIVVNSFTYSSGHNNKLFFGIVDLDDSSIDIFTMLNVDMIPTFIHFPAVEEPVDQHSSNHERVGDDAKDIAKWIMTQTNIQFKVFRPPNYYRAVALLMLFILSGSFFYARRSYLQFRCNKEAWAVIAVFFCLVFVSGHMWNHVVSPAFFNMSENGPVDMYGFEDEQYILESCIITLLYGAVVVSMIIMIEAAGGVRGSEAPARAQGGETHRFTSVVGLALVCVFFSLLLSLFRAKIQGYPFSFLFR